MPRTKQEIMEKAQAEGLAVSAFNTVVPAKEGSLHWERGLPSARGRKLSAVRQVQQETSGYSGKSGHDRGMLLAQSLAVLGSG